jgi:hypothetical protein
MPDYAHPSNINPRPSGPMKATGLDLFLIGLDHRGPGISTDSARGPEATGNEITGRIRTNDTREGAAPLPRGTARLSGSTISISAGQSYRTSSPVTVRPISIRWISDVPSKIVKILAVGAVSAGQRPVGPRGISTDSAPHVRGESRFPPTRSADYRSSPNALQPADEGAQEVGGCPPRRSVHGSGAAGTSR